MFSPGGFSGTTRTNIWFGTCGQKEVVCLLILSAAFNPGRVKPDEPLSFWTGDADDCSQKEAVLQHVASLCCNVMRMMKLSNILQYQSEIYQLGIEFNVIFERTK